MSAAEVEVMHATTCGSCQRPRFGARLATLLSGEQMLLCAACREAQGTPLAAPEGTTPSIVDAAIARVELVEVTTVKCHCDRCQGRYTVAEHRRGMEALGVLTAAAERAEVDVSKDVATIEAARAWLGSSPPSPSDTDLRRMVRGLLLDHDVLRHQLRAHAEQFLDALGIAMDSRDAAVERELALLAALKLAVARLCRVDGGDSGVVFTCLDLLALIGAPLDVEAFIAAEDASAEVSK